MATPLALFPLGFGAPLWLLALVPVLGFALLAERRSRRRLAPSRRRLVRAARFAALLALVLALADLRLVSTSERLTLVFALDESQSMDPAARSAGRALIAEASGHAADEDRTAVVVAGAQAMVDTRPREAFRARPVLARPDPEGTDLAAALRLARGLVPPGEEGRIVLASDGLDTSGALEEAAAALPEEIELVWWPLKSSPGAEVLVESVVAPPRAAPGETIPLRVVVESSRETSALLRVSRGGATIAASRITLTPGRPNVFTIEDRAPEESATLFYRAEVVSDDDGTTLNNRAEALVAVRGAPRVLLVDPEPAALAGLARALEAEGLAAERVPPEALPAELARLAGYDALALSNAPATRFSDQQLDALALYVEALGGGLLMLGGPDAFGPGGWIDTPVERVLPVSMEVRNPERLPSLGLIVLIDKSGSMAMGTGGTSNIELAKAAAVALAENTMPIDRLGVIAFDAAAKWVVPLTPGGDPGPLRRQLGTLRGSGGTDVYPAMQLGGEALAATELGVKHMIVLTDGHVAPRDHEGLAKRLYGEEVSVSTVAIGPEADMYTLERIAEWGGGTFYRAPDPRRLPRIFLREAFSLARSWTVEETTPLVVAADPLSRTLRLGDAPPIEGYVGASDKSGAQIHARSPDGDPILATWRIGLGKSAALTTDAHFRWSAPWREWEGGAPLFAQLFRWTLRAPESGRLVAEARVREGRLELGADAFNARGGFANDESLVAIVARPDGARVRVPLRQSGPGRYEASLNAEEAGAYLAAIVPKESASSAGAAASAAAVAPYSSEYRVLGARAVALERLVRAGRARVVEDPAQLYERRGVGATRERSLVAWLLALAACLLLVEVAARRLSLPRLAPIKARARAETPAHLEALARARERARRHEPEPSVSEASAAKVFSAGDRPTPRRPAADDAARGSDQALGGRGGKPPTSRPRPEESGKRSSIERLLEARKRSS